MSFCEHCQGQRFDRAQVLRTIRQVREELRQSTAGPAVDHALALALQAVRTLEIPHLEPDEDDDPVIH
jgi:hypothetical protein